MHIIRTYRMISLTTLILIGLCGVAAHYATSAMHDSHTSTSTLFAVAWIFSALGVAASAVIIGAVLSEDFGESKVIGNLFAGLIISTFIFAIGGGIACGINAVWTTDSADGLTSTDHFDSMRFICDYCGGIAGLVIGFFVTLLVCIRPEWIAPTNNQTSAVPLTKIQ